jgi:hypothetical protein
MRSRARIRDDSGVALVTVVGIATILFLLVTTLLVLTTYRTMQSSRYVSRMQATHLADAGLNFYLYRLGIDYTYYDTTPTPVPSATTAQGSWSASASVSTTTQLVTIRSVGTATDGTRRTVVAQCSAPGYASYVMLSNGSITVGSSTIIYGPVRSNGSITINTGGTYGWITGFATAYGTLSPLSGSTPNPSYFKGGGLAGNSQGTQVKQVDFASVTQDIASMKLAAGLSLPSSRSDGKTTSALGYSLTFSNNQVRVARVLSECTTSTAALGRLNVDASTAATYAIPANGVIYVNADNVWVQGTYTSRVTVCATGASTSDTTYGNIRIADSVLCGCASNPRITCGLLAQNNVYLPGWYQQPTIMDKTLTVQAAILAENGAFTNDPNDSKNYGQTWTHDLSVSGSMASYGVPGFDTAHWGTRTYQFDSRLATDPPPYWPKTDDLILVSSWLEN